MALFLSSGHFGRMASAATLRARGKDMGSGRSSAECRRFPFKAERLKEMRK